MTETIETVKSMGRESARIELRRMLDYHGLSDWSCSIDSNPESPYGSCSWINQTIKLNGYHCDIHPRAEVIDTIKHEVAHALTPNDNSHGAEWQACATNLGALPVNCSKYFLPKHAIDAIRSGKVVELITELDTVVKQSYKVGQIASLCPDCGKEAIELFNIKTVDKNGDEVQLITLKCFHIIKKVLPKATPFETMVSNSWKPEIATCIHDWNKTKCNRCGEFRLYPFQLVGVRKAEYGLAIQKGFGFFDDMGLGKTVQALAIVKYHSVKYTPTLYVVKSAITFQWFKQIIKWLGPDFLPQIIRTSRDSLLPGLKSYVISYDLLRRMPRERMDALGIKLVILDECQQIKNPDSTRTQEVRRIVSNPDVKVLPLSGTPWKNRGGEFFPVLNMINPVKFWSFQAFLDNDVEFYYEGSKKKQGGFKNIPQFKEKTENMLIRREFNEVMDEFPDINRMKMPVELDSLSQTTYDEAQGEFVEWYNNAIIGGEEDNLNGIEILAKMAKMRHITGLAKIPATLGFVEEFVEDCDRKLVIFTHHKDVQKIMNNCLIDTTDSNKEWKHLAQYLKDNGIKVMELTADYSDAERFEIQESFQSTNRVIMTASTQACGEGIDLQTCCDSILHERQWNPQNEDQATPGRFRRIGQKSSVINITCVQGEDTIDEDLDFIVEGKRAQYHKAMNNSVMQSWSDGDLGKALASRIVAKHNKKHPVTERPKSITQSASLRLVPKAS